MKDKITAIVCGNGDFNTEGFSGFLDIRFFQNEDDALSFYENNRGIDAIVTIGISENYPRLYTAPFEIRKKWVNFENFVAKDIEQSIISTLLANNGRDRGTNKLFSIFTCAYKTTTTQFERLYNSLKAQTYNNWNWWILDDSPVGYEMAWLKDIDDSRIKLLRNYTNHGSIGFNKHVIAMACDGDYLVEVDHDDELTPDCLERLLRAFLNHPDSHFVYSDALELVGEHMSVSYGDGFSCGQGKYRKETVNGWTYKTAITCPSINARSIRSIHAQPNHVRAWEKNFYHSIGGHYEEFSVCDDMDILVRTFLHTRITHINKVLYIQYEYDRGNRNSENTNTQTKRFETIQVLNNLLRYRYDEQIHNRIIELGFKDTAWNEDIGRSEIYGEGFEEIDYGYQEYA